MSTIRQGKRAAGRQAKPEHSRGLTDDAKKENDQTNARFVSFRFVPVCAFRHHTPITPPFSLRNIHACFSSTMINTNQPPPNKSSQVADKDTNTAQNPPRSNKTVIFSYVVENTIILHSSTDPRARSVPRVVSIPSLREYENTPLKYLL